MIMIRKGRSCGKSTQVPISFVTELHSHFEQHGRGALRRLIALRNAGMILRCRTCGKDNTVPDGEGEYICTNCSSKFTLRTGRVIEREQPQPSDPLEDFR